MNNTIIKKGRLNFIIVISLALTIALLYSYVSLIFTPARQPGSVSVPSERGSILDRNGKVLAIQANTYSIVVTPSVIKDAAYFASIIAPITGQDVVSMTETINKSSGDYLYLKKKINQSEHDDLQAAINAHGFSGIRLEKSVSRSYPENSLASHVIGFMGDSGEGLSGAEHYFQETLQPRKANDENGAAHGKNIVLTIDSALQYKLEEIAKKSLEQTQAESLMLIAAQVKTGEILSYISLPAANLNNYPQTTDAERTDRPTVMAYEPGSVFKVFSVASFIDSGAITPSDTFVCDGVFEIKTQHETVRINCLDKHGRVTAREALQYSCNDALAQMSQKIDSAEFIKRLRSFGFGAKTGIELSGETRGFLKSPEERLWSLRSKPTIAIGQEMSVSALQMVKAGTAFANGGTPVRLTLLSKITDRNGVVEYTHQPSYEAPVISTQTADYLLSCMETTARVGTGFRAALNDVSLGVKTGTAQIIDSATGAYSSTDFLSNCLAIFPVENPSIILYIVITKAQGETYAGRIVAPVIAEAADAIIDHMGLSRNTATSVTHPGVITLYPDKGLAIGATVPDFTGTPKRSIMSLLNRGDITVKISGDGWVYDQNPPAGTPITENMVIELFLH